MSLTCRAVRLQLPSMDDPGAFEGSVAGHVGRCLRCQAEISRYRRLHRSLGILADEVVTAPDGLAEGVDARIAGAGHIALGAPARVARVAAAAGAVVAAAGTVAVVRWMRTRSAA